MSIVSEAEQLITELLNNGLSPDHRYHDLEHTLSVREASVAIAKHLGLSGDEIEILELASLLHDTGFTKVYEGHEEASSKIARQFLKSKQYPEEKLKKLIECIDVTRALPQNAQVRVAHQTRIDPVFDVPIPSTNLHRSGRNSYIVPGSAKLDQRC